jgi:hypothetical protein
MATVDKAFRIKNGLVVEGSSATVNGSNVLTEASTEFLQDTTAAMFTNGAQSGITFTYNDTTGVIDAAVSATPTFADRIIFEGATPDDFELTLLVVEPTSDVTVTLPNATDTLVGKATTDTLTNKSISGATNTLSAIGNASLTNSAVTVNGTSISLGASGTVTANTTNALTIGTGLSGTSFNGSSAVTVAIDSTVATTSGTQTLTNKTLTSPVVTGLTLNDSSIVFEGATPDNFETTLTVTDPTADRTITIPNVTGTIVTTGDTATVTDTMLASDSVTNAKIANDAVDTAEIKDAAVTNSKLAGSISNDKLANSAITINGTSTSLGGTRTLVTDDIAEDGSPTNLWFTDERAQDAVAQAIANGTQTNITITYNDAANSLSFNASGGVSSIAGTANQITASASTGAVTLSLPSAVTFPGTVTLNADPTQPLQAATKQYVDNVAEGLHIHPSVNAATTANLTATYSNGTDGVGATLTNSGTQEALVLDGVTLTTSQRVLVKNQSTALQNGIYTVTNTGSVSTNWVLTRATDMDTSAECDGGDFVFVTAGTTLDNTGWVQTETGITIGTSSLVFTQFSGAGTYLAGNGLTLTGNTFSINTGVTADLTTAQTLTNKTLTSPILTTPSISGMLILDNNIVIEGTDDTHETTLTFTDPTQDNTITFKNATGTVAFTSDIETAVDNFGGAVVGGTGVSASYASTSNILTITNTDLGSSQNIFKNVVVGATTVSADTNNDTLTLTAGSGISLTANSTTDTVDIANSGVLSIAGTTNQITASASTGAVTLSLPQSIAATSSPTFAALSVGTGSLTAGSVTLTDALLGTATTSVTTTSATVVDTWSATTYNSAKYIVQMKNGNDIEVLEVLVTIDANNNVYLTEYADVISNAQIGTTDADYLSGNVRLLVTSTNGTTVKVHKTLIEA